MFSYSSCKITVKTMLNLLTITMAAALLLLAGSTEGQSTPSCAQKLIPCADYINGTVTPSTECCSSIKDAVTNERACLCNLYNTPGLLQSLGVNVTQALQLTSRCGVTADLSACSKAEAPTTSTTGTTPTTTTPAGIPGNNGAKMAWTGFSSLVLLLGYVLA